MTKTEQLRYVREGLEFYASLKQKPPRTNEVGWIAQTLGCSRATATRLIAEVRAQEATA